MDLRAWIHSAWCHPAAFQRAHHTNLLTPSPQCNAFLSSSIPPQALHTLIRPPCSGYSTPTAAAMRCGLSRQHRQAMYLRSPAQAAQDNSTAGTTGCMGEAGPAHAPWKESPGACSLEGGAGRQMRAEVLSSWAEGGARRPGRVCRRARPKICG